MMLAMMIIMMVAMKVLIIVWCYSNDDGADGSSDDGDCYGSVYI